jgi:hypothetical protein
MSEVRKWLGYDAEGRAWMPKVIETGYGFADGVASDWDLWRQLLPNAPAAASTVALERALSLVRGRPFLNLKAPCGAWIGAAQAEMIAQIVDAAWELGLRRLESGQWLDADAAAATGARCAPEAEYLHQLRIVAAYATGNLERTQEAIDRLTVWLDHIDDVMQDDTAHLVGHIDRRAPKDRLVDAFIRAARASDDEPRQVG